MITRGWTLEDGLRLIRAIQDKTKEFGYHITLGGSILNKGESEKDLDLYFHPFNNAELKEDPKGIVEWLDKLWGKGQDIGDYSRKSGIRSELSKYYEMHPAQEVFMAEPEPQVELRHREWVEIEQALAPLDYGEVIMTKVNKPKAAQPGVEPYKFKLKFFRPTGDRIDVFIL